MTRPTPALRFALLLAAIVLVAALAALPDLVPVAIKLALPAIAAGLVGFAGWRALDRSRDTLARQVAQHETTLAASAKAASQMRHDLRGMLSPALLTADRLSTNTDPGARRAAETMISSIERMEERLRQP